MSKSIQIRSVFFEASISLQYQNQWFGDNAWREILENHYDMDTMTKQNINNALNGVILESPLRLHHTKSRLKLDNNKSTLAHFYFIENEHCLDEQLQPLQSWTTLYLNYNLSNKRTRSVTPPPVVKSPPLLRRIPPGNPRDVTPPSRPLPRWNSNIAKKLGAIGKTIRPGIVLLPIAPLKRLMLHLVCVSASLMIL